MSKHEIMFILVPTLDKEGTKAEIEKLKGIIDNNGSKVEDVKEIGLRDLAYEIKNQIKGYYVVFTVASEDMVALKEFDRLAKINTNVLRHLVIKL